MSIFSSAQDHVLQVFLPSRSSKEGGRKEKRGRKGEKEGERGEKGEGEKRTETEWEKSAGTRLMKQLRAKPRPCFLGNPVNRPSSAFCR